MINQPLHELIQAYLEQLYAPYARDIQKSQLFYENEQYGELYYYSYMTLLSYLNMTDTDHFLDIGSGLGKIIFQTFLTSSVASVSGIEINTQRHQISTKIKETLQQQLPELFTHDRQLQIIQGDFLKHSFTHISVVYVCATVFSFELLKAIGKKVNSMQQVKKIVSFGKLPYLNNFKLINNIFLHADWERVPCFIYERNVR